MNPVLEVNNLGIDFGGLTAVNNLNMVVEPHEIVGLIGPNGAGKTTVFNMLTKVYEPSRGNIILNGQDIAKMNTVEVNKAGVARTFQNIRLFADLSVIDNVKSGMNNLYPYSVFDTLLHTRKRNENEKKITEKAEELLKIFNLYDAKDIEASSLPYGAQRRLEIARALATDPKLLLLDEPAAGMNPQETDELMQTIRFVRDQFDIAILLIEHDMSLVMNICERIYVLNYGMLLAKGSPEEIRNDDRVIKAYLGD
ncbi:MAG: ABC transporter ATP-binding protein [Erysipelotrichaceae bacterium]|jgi:branched-chain amino acid transport system ATP-binding protein|nr:ABC transporter ATP-binding protein [Erysipelotrichaceae bacterium]MCR5095773.1 ABC transporter ATP-binding protein [Erysipelotrichaceae bacterium]